MLSWFLIFTSFVCPFLIRRTALGVIFPESPPAPPSLPPLRLAPAPTPKLTSTRGTIMVSSIFVASPTTVFVDINAFAPLRRDSITELIPLLLSAICHFLLFKLSDKSPGLFIQYNSQHHIQHHCNPDSSPDIKIPFQTDIIKIRSDMNSLANHRI